MRTARSSSCLGGSPPGTPRPDPPSRSRHPPRPDPTRPDTPQDQASPGTRHPQTRPLGTRHPCKHTPVNILPCPKLHLWVEIKQEWIPVRCVPSTTVAICWGGGLLFLLWSSVMPLCYGLLVLWPSGWKWSSVMAFWCYLLLWPSGKALWLKGGWPP